MQLKELSNMKKTVFVTLMMADNIHKRHFPVDRNSFIEYSGECYYAINAVLAQTMTADDEIKVILIQTKGGDDAGSKNATLFMDELNSLNKCGASIKYEVIPSNFVETKEKFKDLYKSLIKNLEYESELYADVTFGPKSLPLMIFAAMQFGEKFFDCSIGNVIYLKAEFKNNQFVEGSQMIYDYTPLYMLNSFTNTIECSSGEKAIAAVEALFEN